MRREYHGGQNARDWRRKVAALARKAERKRLHVQIQTRRPGRRHRLRRSGAGVRRHRGNCAGEFDRLGLCGAPVRVPAVFQSCGNAPVRESQPIPRSRLCQGAPCAHRNRKRRRYGPVHRKRLYHAPAKKCDLPDIRDPTRRNHCEAKKCKTRRARRRSGLTARRRRVFRAARGAAHTARRHVARPYRRSRESVLGLQQASLSLPAVRRAWDHQSHGRSDLRSLYGKNLLRP